MYTVEVRDHIMIAHSLPNPFFGPAQRLHGATFIVDAAFSRTALDRHEVVVDIGRATDILRAVLAELTYRNLDEVEALKGRLTTTEFLCRYIFDGIVAAIGRGELGPDGAPPEKLRVGLEESHVARAWFEGPVALG